MQKEFSEIQYRKNEGKRNAESQQQTAKQRVRTGLFCQGLELEGIIDGGGPDADFFAKHSN